MADEAVLSVSEITTRIKSTLEHDFAGITVEGEISNFRPAASGHLYFSLKDSDAMLSAVMFRGNARGLQFQPQDGMLVRASGNISVYPKRGNYQIICQTLGLAGQGDLLVLLEERKKRLTAEGLFDADRKRPLPILPGKIAIITSPTGAAIRDILHVLRRRAAGIDVVVLPTLVQGDEAAPTIAHQIETANRYHLGDVLILTRGGGSLEDLLPFYEEIVVRAVAASEIPIISAVGHEIDMALTDFAADMRAPTPSAAAELVSSSRLDLLRRVREHQSAMEAVFGSRLERVRILLGQFTAKSLEMSLNQLIQPVMQRHDDARISLLDAARDRLQQARHRHELAFRDLQGMSPLAILRRGYAVVTKSATGEIVRMARQVGPAENLAVRLHQGSLKTTVEEVLP